MKASSRFVRFSRFWVCGRFSAPCAGGGTSPLVRAPSTHVLDPNRNELILSRIGGPPCWKRGGKLGQIDDNRWSAIRQGGVPWSRNSLTWGFAGAFFSLRPVCRKRPDLRLATTDYRAFARIRGRFRNNRPFRKPPLLCEPLLAAVDPYPSPSRLSLFCNVFPSQAHTPQPVAIL